MATIRKAHFRDAKKLAEAAEATFMATFAAMNTKEHMELHCRSCYGEEIQLAEISDPELITLLSEDNENLVGYAQLRWGEAPICISATHPGEIQRLYVIENWHGRGIAQELMGACIEEVKQRGSDAVWLGVWERNPRAISFYEKFGFVAVGEHIFPLGGDPQRDIVMVRAIASE
ncbi:MAG: GNAT family N-acetyltransferase [Rhodanobacter sp.]